MMLKSLTVTAIYFKNNLALIKLKFCFLILCLLHCRINSVQARWITTLLSVSTLVPMAVNIFHGAWLALSFSLVLQISGWS